MSDTPTRVRKWLGIVVDADDRVTVAALLDKVEGIQVLDGERVFKVQVDLGPTPAENEITEYFATEIPWGSRRRPRPDEPLEVFMARQFLHRIGALLPTACFQRGTPDKGYMAAAELGPVGTGTAYTSFTFRAGGYSGQYRVTVEKVDPR